MLAMLDVPQWLEELDKSNRMVGMSIAQSALDRGSRNHLSKGEDLLASAEPSVYFIEQGVYKYFAGSKLIRLYNASDLIVSEAPPKDHRLVSDFGSQVVVWPRPAFEQAVASDPALLGKWHTYLHTEIAIMHALCALLLHDEVSPNATIKSYEPGDIIINEGEMAREIFEMLEGSATVTIHGKEVGMVKSGEVFGEISFLTSSMRTATVKASTKCLVTVMNEQDLVRLIKFRPTMNIAISKTLAQRLVDANRKLVGE